jgi:glycosyltransferase involved in cell wall biosynthesis
MTRGLRIGVDALPFQAKPAGVVRYLRNVLLRMLEISPSTHFVLYSSRQVAPQLPAGNWSQRAEMRSGLHAKTPIWLQRTLPEWLEDDHIDLFWGQNNAMPLSLRHRCARLLTVHDLTPLLLFGTMSFRHGIQSRVTIRAAARASHKVIAVSKATALLLQRKLGIPRERLEVVYEGVDESLFKFNRDEAIVLLRHRFDLRPPFLLSVNTIEPRKDYPTLIRALRASASLPPLVIAGGAGWRHSSIMAQIERAQQDGIVRYLGRVSDEDLSALYSATDLLVYSSLYEGFGLPVLEAMSCGCPVLCSWTSSLPEVGGDAVCYFRAHDAEDLAYKLVSLVSDPDRRRRMSERGLERARTMSFRVAARRTLSIMKQLVNEVHGAEPVSRGHPGVAC